MRSVSLVSVIDVAPDGLTCITSHITVQTAEHDIDLVFELVGCAILDYQISELFAHGQALLPFDGIAVLFARRSRAGSHGGELKVRVKGEEENESLTNTTGRTQDTYIIKL
jgi:hypothetical protein